MTPTHPPEATGPALGIRDVIIDCRDVDAVAAFWSALLQRPVVARFGPYAILERAEIGLGFQQVDEPKGGKNRLHLDLGSADPLAEQHRVEALGGRRVEGFSDGGFLVMADPEGNEFCLVPQEPFDVSDEGRATYLDRPAPTATPPAAG